MLAFLPPFLMQVFSIPARFVLGVYLFLDNVVPFLFAGAGGVAHGAHIGGFLAGGLVAWVMDRRGTGDPAAGHRDAEGGADRRPGGPRGPGARAATTEAASDYFALPAAAARGALSPERGGGPRELAAGQRARGRGAGAAATARCATRPGAKGLAEVYALAGFILLDDKGEATAAYQYLLTALELGPKPETAADVRRELALIEAQQRLHPGRYPRPH